MLRLSSSTRRKSPRIRIRQRTGGLRRHRRRAPGRGQERDLADEVAGLASRNQLPVAPHLDRALDEHNELASQRVLPEEHGALGHLEVIRHARELDQLLLRQPLEERRATERLGLPALTQPTHQASLQPFRAPAARLPGVQGETRYAKSGELNIAYQVLGDGPFDLVFAPGYMSHLEQNQWWPPYKAFIDRIASFSRLIVFDRRGTGLSDRILEIGAYEEMMDDVLAVMDAAASGRAALLGGAEGGPICALFAATFPERTAALVLASSYPRRTWAPDYPWGLDEDALQAILVSYETKWGRGDFGLNSLAPSVIGDERFRQWYAQACRFAGTPSSALAWFRVTMEIDIRDVLPAIRVPTLVIHRAGDRVIPVEAGRYLAEHIAGAKYVELPAATTFPSRRERSRRSTRSRSS